MAEGTDYQQACTELAAAMDRYAAEVGCEREIASICQRLEPAFDAAGDVALLVDCLALQGDALYYVGDFKAARKPLRRAFELGYTHFPEDVSTYPLRMLAACETELDRPEQARRIIEQQIRHLEERDPYGELPGARYALAQLVYADGEYEDAIALLLGALAASQSAEQPAEVTLDTAEILLLLGKSCLQAGRTVEAGQYLRQARERFRKAAADDGYPVADRQAAVLDLLLRIAEVDGRDAEAEELRQERDALNQ
jgi:tetratricopeptide (TPR) repeat protein